MFGKKKVEKRETDQCNFVAAPMRVAEPSLVDTLRDRRTQKIKAANDLDREIAALDYVITWLEHNPKAQGVLREFINREV